MDKVYRFHKEDKVVFLNKKAMRTFVKLNKRQKQMSLLTGSILSVFAVLTMFNDKIAYESKLIAMKEASQQSRNIASVNSLANQAYQNAFQEKLLVDLKKDLQKEAAVYAKQPSKKDSFLKGKMMGSYQIENLGKNKMRLQYHLGQKYKMTNANTLVLSFLETFYQGDFREIKKVSQVDTSIKYQVVGDDGSLQSLEIGYDKTSHEIQTIELK